MSRQIQEAMEPVFDAIQDRVDRAIKRAQFTGPLSSEQFKKIEADEVRNAVALCIVALIS